MAAVTLAFPSQYGHDYLMSFPLKELKHLSRNILMYSTFGPCLSRCLLSIEFFLSLDPSYHSAVYKREMRSYLTEIVPWKG